MDENDIWSLGGGVFSNANGSKSHPYSKFGLSSLVGTLVGSLDGGKTFFQVGTKWDNTVLKDGVLSLYYWDSDFANNSDFVTVNVQVEGEATAVTEPPSECRDVTCFVERGDSVSWQAVNYPARFIRHKGFLGFIDPIA